MKASLDTNVIIHLYNAKLERILFDFFDEGVCIYEKIREIELRNHAESEILERIDEDIKSEKIQVYTYDYLRELKVNKIFDINFRENRLLYNPNDLGEVYAISLAQTIGAYSLVTNDVKQGGPYMSLLHFVDNDIMPLNFADILILMFISKQKNAIETVRLFDTINKASNLNWSFSSQLKKFIKRFNREPYKIEEKDWFKEYCRNYNVEMKIKFEELYNEIKSKE